MTLSMTVTFWYNTEDTICEKIIDKLGFIKIKNICEKQCREDEKTIHRLGENICKRHI